MISKTNELIAKLASTVTGETMFNPYNQICKNHDVSTAPGLRQGNLRIYLDSHVNVKTDVLWVFDTLDYFSTKISGVPLVEPQNYRKVEDALGLAVHFERANKNGTATDTHRLHTKVWDTLAENKPMAVVWHVLPFYSHSGDNIATKRTPTQNEYLEHAEFMHLIIDLFKPKTIYANDSKAKDALSLLSIKSKLHTLTNTN